MDWTTLLAYISGSNEMDPPLCGSALTSHNG